MDEEKRFAAPRRRRGVYLLPNLFTTATLFGGFYAIIAAMNAKFSHACIAVAVAMAADSLDGLVARKTNTASEFGKEYDSLCDMVAFGVATSIVMYSFSLHYLSAHEWLGGKLGWLAAFLFTACAALRLARFNVLASRGGAKGNFFGLPSPGAAAVLIGFVWMSDRFGWRGSTLVLPAVILTIGAGILMVTNLRFFSIKTIRLTQRVPFRYIVFSVGVLALFCIEPPLTFFLIFFSYALSGPVLWLYGRARRPAAAAVAAPREPPAL
ncbi:MAG TPA: CDP-diacylglycerol--serine O-phosphatidyltransferase [Candidatus Binatia bacterium]|nr:CDP-diacylglycerol--serine O-phosphatidyltransferase [Candidatus Binatia bacterium]